MAALTPREFTDAVCILAEQLGTARLRDRLASLGAFTSRRGLNTPVAIAERLFHLSGGLRRQSPATFAFTRLWTEVVTGGLDAETEKKLEALADAVNACLTADNGIAPGKEADLDRALAAVIGPARARLDMLLKAVPAVAERLRAEPQAET